MNEIEWLNKVQKNFQTDTRKHSGMTLDNLINYWAQASQNLLQTYLQQYQRGGMTLEGLQECLQREYNAAESRR